MTLIIAISPDIKCKIKPQLYDGSDDLEEYLTQLYLLAKLNDWEISRFGSINWSEVFRAELQTRVSLRNESLSEQAQTLKKRTRRAYPGTTPIVRDTLALDYFIDAITKTDIRLRLREVGPKTIYENEHIAVRLEALRLADRPKGRSVRIANTCDTDDSEMVSEIKEIKLGIKIYKMK
ncbi:unnamed protein product [Mytilus coruscus]|uniref:Uncharacterized protein n=1 Tax=Mytilus coruscus TaxID=42192 RepID=A0A6J8EEK9_MYTCO|nr:unnamed protein product [Mytilus coruscus]